MSKPSPSAVGALGIHLFVILLFRRLLVLVLLAMDRHVPGYLVRTREPLFASWLCACIGSDTSVSSELKWGSLAWFLKEPGESRTCLDRFEDSANAL
jgi:hypothetical protein